MAKEPTTEISPWGDGPPPQVRALRYVGFFSITALVIGAMLTEPRPAFTGRGLEVLVALAVFVATLVKVVPRRGPPMAFMNPAWLVAMGASVVAMDAAQPRGAATGGIYVLAVMAGLRLHTRAGAVILVLTLAGLTISMQHTANDPSSSIPGIWFGVIPWFLVMKVMRTMRENQVRTQELIIELEETRAAHAESAALGERTRLARDMHDVLAHSLSALALQLEGTRLLARRHDADPEVQEAIDRAHHLAASGLAEASRAIGALRGDELPGPERLPDLAHGFTEQAGVACELTVEGTPRELPSDARLALYRTAQEALTNVRKHAAPERVELCLDYRSDGTALRVVDHGAPPANGSSGPGSGYGITGMRERAALLGGRLLAGPTDDGFQVELWLPA